MDPWNFVKKIKRPKSSHYINVSLRREREREYMINKIEINAIVNKHNVIMRIILDDLKLQ